MKLNVFKNCLVLTFVASTAITYAQTAEEVSAAIRKEDYATAKNLCKQWMVKDPKSGDPYFFLGEIQYENGKADSASMAYTQGLTVNEDSWLCMTGQIKLLTDRKKSWTLVAVTNDPILASRCDRVFVMQDGEIVEEGTFEQIEKSVHFEKILK